MTDYMDPNPPPLIDHAANAQKMLEGMRSGWEAGVTLGKQATITRPGWQITMQWEGMYQAIAVSSKYRFVGLGVTPLYALEAAMGDMRRFRDELTQHLEAF